MKTPPKKSASERPTVLFGGDPPMHHSFLFTSRCCFIGKLSQRCRKQKFFEAFHLLLQYHIFNAAKCRHDFYLSGKHDSLDLANVHEKFIFFLKEFRRMESEASGEVSQLLASINNVVRDLFPADAVSHLIQTNNEALTKDKHKLRAEIESYWSLESEDARDGEREAVDGGMTG